MEQIEHFGVKGMHWGIRRKTRSNYPMSEDVANVSATKALIGHRVKVRKTDVLSNKELQSLVTRMNLEKQYADVFNKHELSDGQRFVKEEMARKRINGMKKAAALSSLFLVKHIGKAFKAAKATAREVM
jgi:hypothetical protein